MGLFDKKIKKAAAVADEPVKPIAEVKAVKTAKASKADQSAPAEVKAKAAPLAVKNGSVYGVLISPLVTEKTAKEEQFGKYAFIVAADATKVAISKAVLARYGVEPVKINVINRLGKYKRFGRNWGQRKDWRKAVVTLPKGKSINVYEAGK
ncbi:MAG: 50S ribosomal protein L23 [Patescibacteria group bacterium]